MRTCLEVVRRCIGLFCVYSSTEGVCAISALSTMNGIGRYNRAHLLKESKRYPANIWTAHSVVSGSQAVNDLDVRLAFAPCRICRNAAVASMTCGMIQNLNSRTTYTSKRSLQTRTQVGLCVNGFQRLSVSLEVALSCPITFTLVSS